MIPVLRSVSLSLFLSDENENYGNKKSKYKRVHYMDIIFVDLGRLAFRADPW
jgi:hypothetical protein